jgi:hypothetical protein
MFVTKIVGVPYDILRGINATLWGGVDEAEKVGKIVKTGLSGADVLIGTSHTLEDASCGDYVCATLDVIGSVSSAVGLVLGNLPTTKRYTYITGSVTVCCRTVRWYCKKYGTFWGCVASVGTGAKEVFKFKIENPN